MRKPVNVLLISLASAQEPELARQREERLRNLSNPAKRLGGLAIHKFASRYPDEITTAINLMLKKHGLKFLGSGGEFTVVAREGDTSVTKVHRGSVDWDLEKQKSLAVRKRFEQSLLIDNLGQLVLHQDVKVDTHPYRKSRTAVQVTQPLLDFEGINIFRSSYPEVDLGRLEGLLTTYPGISNELRSFISCSRKLDKETGYLPDTLGLSNLVITKIDDFDEVKLLDSMPMGPEQQEGQALVRGHLGALENALDELAA